MGGSIRWFVDNPVAANLLMLFLVVGGFFGLMALDKQFFPRVELNTISISMPYPGAGPREVEEQICVRIEQAIYDLNGIKEIRSSAREGLATLTIKAETGTDVQRLTAEIKNRVDAIDSFPGEAERPVVTELPHRYHMAVVTLAGELDERELKELGEALRDDLAAQPHVSVVELASPRRYEVSIEVSEYTLRRYGLNFDTIVTAIRGTSLNLPAGTIKASDGDIRLQSRGQAYTREEFENIPLLSNTDGTQIVLGDVATIVDGFEDLDIQTRFNGKPSHNLHVYVTSRPNTLATSKVVNEWLERARETLPDGVELEVWQDSSLPFQERINTLVNNGLGGLVLVFIVLMLFLRPQIALWVCVGIVVAFMGSFFFMQYAGVSLNMMSLFALLLILGIVVDDAIIVGESIHSRQMAGFKGANGAKSGARIVFRPVMYAVLSTMIFFAAMLFLPGDLATVARSVAVVALLALGCSLLESLWILPSHLAPMREPVPSRFQLLRNWETFRLRFADGLTHFAHNKYRPLLSNCLDNNLLVCALFVLALFFSLALYGGGWLRSSFFPVVQSDYVTAHIKLPEGGAFNDAVSMLDKVESAALLLKTELNGGAEGDTGRLQIGNIESEVAEDAIRVVVESRSDEVDTAQLALRWQDLIGDIGDVEDFSMNYTLNDLGKPIKLVLASTHFEDLQLISSEASQLLQAYPGVHNVRDSLQSQQQEIVLELKPAAENLSITLAALANQVRTAFHGAEVQRIPRLREDVRVMVRYPETDRVSVNNLRDMRIRSPSGEEVPFDTVASVRFEAGYPTIERLNRKRTVEITAEVADGTSAPRAIVQDIATTYLPQWQQRFPDLTMEMGGELREQAEFLGALIKYMVLAMIGSYALMAIPFGSYWQPLLVLTAVPFGVMGAIFGHLLMGLDVSLMSLLGIVACAGVVVNDNLVLIDRINNLQSWGSSLKDALVQAGEDRFRPIALTSLTTFVGLLPIMAETSFQAQFLIPMVVSLAFGVLFATGVTLLLVPSLYLLGVQIASGVKSRTTAASNPSESESPDAREQG